MERNREIAWSCLTEREQQSLYLTLSHGKSTWEAGNILGLAHYKYLELKKRSEYLFKLFSDYFEKHETLFRPKAPIKAMFRDYIYACLMKRLPKEEALCYVGDSIFRVVELRSEHISQNLDKLKFSEDPWDRDTYGLILEFDRWNAFRILPRKDQAPSAYNRRSGKKFRTYVKYLHSLPSSKVKAMVDLYWYKGKKNRLYISLVNSSFKDGYQVVPIKDCKDMYILMTKLKLYVFNDQEDAEIFGALLASYPEFKSPKAGLKFWGDFRVLIERSLNYKDVNNLEFDCKTLDKAYEIDRKARVIPKGLDKPPLELR